MCNYWWSLKRACSFWIACSRILRMVYGSTVNSVVRVTKTTGKPEMSRLSMCRGWGGGWNIDKIENLSRIADVAVSRKYCRYFADKFRKLQRKCEWCTGAAHKPDENRAPQTEGSTVEATTRRGKTKPFPRHVCEIANGIETPIEDRWNTKRWFLPRTYFVW